MVELGRRGFLRAMGLAGTSVAIGGCSEPTRRLIPYIQPPEDVITGVAAWYATTCRECPAGCGLLAKNVDGHVIKVEGNSLHPVSAGKLCARGQASLHGLYNPDRFGGPLLKKPGGTVEPISWDRGEDLLARHIREAVQKGRGERIVFMTELMTGTLRDLGTLWLGELGNPNGPVMYEPFAYEPLRKANRNVFGWDEIPHYRIDHADFLISFGAGFLETWLSNVEYSRQFASYHAVDKGGKKPFIHVGPRLSMTAANADLWVQVPPGAEYLIGLGMLRVILDEDHPIALNETEKLALKTKLDPWPLDEIVARTGIERELIRNIAHRFAASEKPLAMAGGLALTGPNPTEAAVAANLLCTLKAGTRETVDAGSVSSYGLVARSEQIKELSEKMKRGEIDLLLIHEVNPVFSLPRSWEFEKSIEAVPMVVSFSSTTDETTALADLILPTHTPLESWGDYSPRKGVMGLMQPVMGPIFGTRHLGDVLISTGKKVKGPEQFPWNDFYEVLQGSWELRRQETAPDIPFQSFWEKAVERGGIWGENPRSTSRLPILLAEVSFPGQETGGKPENAFDFTVYPTVQFFDGRMTNRLWIQELPDPITQVTWGGWVEIHPETAARLNIVKGEMLQLKSPYGTLEVPALPIPSVPPGTLAMPLGQGHTDYGRFADGLPANPMHLLPSDIDPLSGGIARPRFWITIEKREQQSRIANTDGSFYQHGRGLVQTTSLDAYTESIASGHKPYIDYPMPEGYDVKKDFYPPHEHVDYRWCMVVDLDRCIGCGACVVACYAENNVAVVGRDQVLKGREMSWLRVQRYFDEERPVAHWLPMLCQHCDSAPCESVCPIFAPHHSKEGLNNQVYNRCFGTRFCSQNDPYKVRRFNWFTFTRPEPLNWQFNPDVTVRQKGVMEKCSFCVQRIAEAKIKARQEGRKKVLDGEFTTACAQTCPADALIFGSLMDPESRVSRMIQDPRAYQVLVHLNTKPAVIYLKKVTREI